MSNVSSLERFQDIIAVDPDHPHTLRFNPIELRSDFAARMRRRLHKLVSWSIRICFSLWCSAYGIGSVFECTQLRVADIPIAPLGQLQRLHWGDGLSICHLLAIGLTFLANESCFRAVLKRRRRELVPMSANAMRPWYIFAALTLFVDLSFVVLAIRNGLLDGWTVVPDGIEFGVGAIYGISVLAFAFFRVESHYSRFI